MYQPLCINVLSIFSQISQLPGKVNVVITILRMERLELGGK